MGFVGWWGWKGKGFCYGEEFYREEFFGIIDLGI
jgi:hypothetical protein